MMEAELILTNGRIYTMDAARPVASACAIGGGRLVAVGSDDEAGAWRGGRTEWVDLGGRCVTPGLVDAHVHFRWYSLARQMIDLGGTRSLEEALARIGARAASATPGEWLGGRSWNHSDWPGGAFPSAADLDRVAGDRPVLIHHKSGHAAWVNGKALRLAGITAETADPPGGQIVRGADGRPTGILLEDAIDLVLAVEPRPTEAELVKAMLATQEHCLQAGLTGLHDFDGRDCFGALQAMRSSGALDLRIVKNIPVALLDYAVGLGLRSGFGDDWLRIGAIKIFADGALGSRTAAMIAPYEGEPGNTGIVVTDKEEMIGQVREAAGNGLTVTIHAIGDRANHDVLDAYEVVLGELESRGKGEQGSGGAGEQGRGGAGERGSGGEGERGRGRLRHRIEHVQVAHPDDFGRLAALGVIASMQPIHATSDMEMADRYWRGRAQFSYAWRTVLETGAALAFGSDAPVDPIEPLTGIHAAVTRRRPDGSPGPEGWYPEQRLTMAETIRAYTWGPAYASGREERMGSVTAGKLADLTIFERDIFAIPADELLEVGIAGTMVGGRFRYRAW